MRNINWGDVTASADGDFQRLPAGPYVVRIISMQDVPDREYVELVYDIAEGEHAGYYSDDWGIAHPYAHHIFLSYKDRALGMLKGRLEAIQDSNPGFDPFAAWDAGRFDMFANRVLGVNLREEEYRKGDGSIAVLGNGERATRLSVCQVVSAKKVRDGEVKAKPRKTIEGGTAQAAQSAPADAYSGPIPWEQ